MTTSPEAGFNQFGRDRAALVPRGRALLEEAALRALHRTRLTGYVALDQLADLMGWQTGNAGQRGRDDYERSALLWVLHGLYQAGRVEPAHPASETGSWGGWRITIEEYMRRRGSSFKPDPASVYPGEWISLARCPRPWSGGPYARPPAVIRMPDGTDYHPEHWRDVLPAIVEWLNVQGLLLPGRNVPFAMMQKRGFLVNTVPQHGDGRPMAQRERAGGPDGLWVNMTTSSSYGHHAITYGRRLVRSCGQSPEDVQLRFRRPQAPGRSAEGNPRGRYRRQPPLPATGDEKKLLWLTFSDDGTLEIWEAKGKA